MIKIELFKLNFLKALITFITFSIVILGVVSYFIYNETLMGPIFISLGLFNFILLWLFKIKLVSVYADIIFGIIDNGILVFAAIIGGSIAGVPGAIVGGAAGNVITDGIGGLFEGHIAENQRRYKIDNLRTALSTSLGKMAGCLIGAGVALFLVEIIKIYEIFL